MRALLTVYVTTQAFLLLMFFALAPVWIGTITQAESFEMVRMIMPLFAGYIGQIVGFYFAAHGPE